MSEKGKLVSIDLLYVTQEIEELMKHPVVQKVVYLQNVLKAAEEVDQPKKPSTSEKTNKE